MKKCIWCNKYEPYVTFNNKAHTFPKSLGGKNICNNVCDPCNKYFGSPSSMSPAIEVVLKEVLNMSKYLILSTLKKVDKRFKSEYFDIDFKQRIIKYKLKYKLRRGFQETFARKFKQGMFKVFLEERERQCGDGHDERFNFIREFARYNLNDYPIFYYRPTVQMIFFAIEDIETPEIRFSEYNDDRDAEFRLFEYPIMGHNFVIPTSRNFHLFFDNYLKKCSKTGTWKKYQLIEINHIEDIDFKFNLLK